MSQGQQSRALILGCSHAAGTAISFEPGLNIELSESQEYGAARSYPVKIAQRLGYRPMNHAISGGSNDAMFRIWHQHRSTLSSDDIVIACWTACNRSELWHPDHHRWIGISRGHIDLWHKRASDVLLQGVSVSGEIQQADAYKNYLKHWTVFSDSEDSGRLNKIKCIEALNHQARRQGIRVINIHSVHPVWDLETDDSWPVDTAFHDWAVDRDSVRSECHHYFEPTHSAFADYVLARLR